MFDDAYGVPVLRGLLSNKKSRISLKNTYSLKRLANGALVHLVNAATPRSARMVERNPVLFEEPAAYDSPEGDTLENFFQRAGNIWNPFFTIGGTPIYPGDYMDQCFHMGDQQYRYYPCPYCSHYQQLTLSKLILEGKNLGKMECENCKVPIHYKHLRAMD
jgi:phage terminase large subunit GpA-like protein